MRLKHRPAHQRSNRDGRKSGSERLGGSLKRTKACARESHLDDRTDMQLGLTDFDQLSRIISHATASAFLLGAVAGFVSILIARMNRIIDRVRSLHMITDDDASRVHLR